MVLILFHDLSRNMVFTSGEETVLENNCILLDRGWQYCLRWKLGEPCVSISTAAPAFSRHSSALATFKCNLFCIPGCVWGQEGNPP